MSKTFKLVWRITKPEKLRDLLRIAKSEMPMVLMHGTTKQIHNEEL